MASNLIENLKVSSDIAGALFSRIEFETPQIWLWSFMSLVKALYACSEVSFLEILRFFF